MIYASFRNLAENGDVEGVKLFLQTHKIIYKNVEWDMLFCMEQNQLHILDVLMAHASTYFKASPAIFLGPLARASSKDEDDVLFERILKYAPSDYRALSSALIRLLEQEKNGSNPYVMKKIELWCEKADAVSLEEALSCAVVWNVPRFVCHIYPKWSELASEQDISSKLFESLAQCFNWGEGQQGATLRRPEIYDFWLAQLSPSLAQQFLDQIAHAKMANNFQCLPGTPDIYEILEPVLHSVVQNEVLKNSVQECAATPSVVRKM